MKTNVKDLGKCKRKLKVELSATEVEESFAKAYDVVRKKANVKGFRPGKVPDEILDKFYGGEVTRESLHLLIESTFDRILKEQNLVPVAQPQFQLKPLDKGKSYTYEAEMEVRPQIEPKNYLGVKIRKRKVDISKDEIEAELDRLREVKAHLVPVEDGASIAKGIVATIDFDGTIDGKPFQGGTAKGYVFECGKGTLLSDFEQKILGMKKGEERSIEVVYPADYHAGNLAGKKSAFRVTVQALHRKELPNLDDEFAKDLGKENLDLVRKEMEGLISRRKEADHHGHYADELMEKLLSVHAFDVPGRLVDEESERSKISKEEATKRTRSRFLLEAIAMKESLRVETKEVEARIQQLARLHRKPVDEVRKFYMEQRLVPALVAEILWEKTLAFLLDKATFENA